MVTGVTVNYDAASSGGYHLQSNVKKGRTPDAVRHTGDHSVDGGFISGGEDVNAVGHMCQDLIKRLTIVLSCDAAHTR